MNSSDVRARFLAFFEERGHTIVPSAPLTTAGDPTLLFVNAGMVPFKDVFLGVEKRSYTRAASCQKCLRVSGKHNDLDEVGPSPRHHTFFEMLGNFSFGDYFKEEAIAWAWEFLTEHLKLDRKRLRPTVFEEDGEAAQLWSRIAGYADGDIVRLGPEDNFWAMGETGPCGPNSEIFYDRTGRCLKDGSDCPLTCDCERWWEVWNLVFMQYDRAPDGTLTPLAKRGIDTGMGLERVTAVLQGLDSDYETDVFAPLFETLLSITGDADSGDDRRAAYRAVADHARGVTFLIADGVMPSNEGRGYVLRRILRRAVYHGRLLGIERPFFTEVCRVVIDTMSAPYPDLRDSQDRILGVVSDEEARFLDTLDAGLTRLERALDDTSAASRVLPGDEAFRLYDTYGFPVDLTRKVLDARGWSIDDAGFDAALEQQRQRGRAATGAGREQDEALLAAVRDLPATTFVGYEALLMESTVLAIFRDGARVDAASEGDAVDIVLDVTPFYAEGGGQVGDSGVIDGEFGAVAVENVRRAAHGVFLHSGRVAQGRIAGGERVRPRVKESTRRATMRNHTATHLLHKALREVLGPQAKQAGSLVAPGRLRFDFFHTRPLSDDELRAAERLVREQVLRDQPVNTDVMPIQDALSLGADAMFDEKYGEEARVVSIGEAHDVVSHHHHEGPPPGTGVFSRELCGGTHCHHTGEIGAFVITEQRSVGAGVRRVEALTGQAAFDWLDERRRVVEQLAREYNVPAAELPERLRALQERARETPKAAPAAGLPDAGELLERAQQRNGALLIIDRVDAPDADALRALGDQLRQRAKSALVVLGSVVDDKPTVLVMLTPDQVASGLDAAKLAKQIGSEMGAGGGGRPDVATAGGRDPARLDAALQKARELLAS